MDSFERARLKKKYGWIGNKYQELISKILIENHSKISKLVLNSDKKQFEKNLKIINKSYKNVKLPEPEKIINQSKIIKSAESGKLLTKTFRNEFRKTITKTLEENKVFTMTGKITKSISQKMQKSLTEFYSGYTEKNPKYKMPTNLKAIATTETRFILNNARQEYVKRINAETNKDAIIVKRWVHNHSLSDLPRNWHIRLSRKKAIGMDALFNYKNDKGQIFHASYPHDPKLPASENINCNCELEYFWVKKKKI